MQQLLRRRFDFVSPARLLMTAGIGAAVLLSAGCSAGSEETTPAAAASTTPPTTIAGQAGTDDGGTTDIDVAIGDCVTLGGTMTAATIDTATCGSAESNYRVIAKAQQNTQCPGDADQVYYETFNGTEQGALCLDIDWVVDGCMSIPTGVDEPRRVECTDPTATNVERVTAILEDTTDVESCSEGGFTYSERRFTVCTETVTT